MSHAICLVAPTKERLAAHGGNIEAALAWEMEPFDENGTCFRDGSRWDWYQVGGRWTGMLDAYDPTGDPRNIEKCDLCGGTGDRAKWRGESHVDQHPSGCNGCSGKGTRVKFSYEPGETLDSYLASRVDNPIHAHAFLRNRHWNESERMGWFGGTTYTECEIADMQKAKGDPAKWFGKCLHKDEESGARIVVWNEPGEIWRAQFHRRFVEPLEPEDTLVVVDYHV